jgi:electron transfer flavoprotein beta subunit
VPARDSRYEISDQADWIKENDLAFEISECDEYALEEALRLQEKHGGEVVVLTLGSERAEKSMRKALAMGAERGVLILDDGKRVDNPLAAALLMAEVLRKAPFDLILAGTQSDDFGYAQTGVMLAELLGLPHATIVMEIQADPQARRLTALREMESGWSQRVELPLPAVLTVQAGSSQVRYASLKGIMLAKKKEIRRVAASSLGIGLDGVPAVHLLRLYFPVSDKKAEILKGDADTVASDLISKLRNEARVL